MPIALKPVSGPQEALDKPREYIAFDTETALIQSDEPFPRVTLMTWMARDDGPHLVTLHDLVRTFDALCRHCLATRTTLTAHNTPFDLCVIVREEPALFPLVFELLDAGLVEDTLLNEKLDDIARDRYDNKLKARWHDLGDGRRLYKYNLADSVRIRLGVTLDKSEDTYRTRYGELRGVPAEQLPEAARAYALDDARAHWLLRMQQDVDEAAAPAREGYYVYADAPAQMRAGFALQLCRWAGIWTDPARTAQLKANLRAKQDSVLQDLVDLGFVRAGRFRPKAKTWVEPSRNTKVIKARIEAACARIGVEPLRTEKGAVSDSEEAIQLCEDPDLEKLLIFKSTQKLLGYTTVLEKGHTHPIHSEPNTLIANGRISWGSANADGVTEAKLVNLTNLPAEPGVRECYVPHPGHYFFAIDYSTLELCTVAQICLWMFGESRLAQYINSGVDMHSKLGSMLLGIDEAEFAARREGSQGDDDKEFIKAVRDLAKRANFGLWGGMGITRFLSTVRDLKAPLRKNGVVLDEGLVKHLKGTWQDMLPETRDYFRIAGSIADGDGQFVHWTSGRIRGGLGYTDASNFPFSGLAADGAKDALYRITRAMYGEPERACFRSFMVAFIHDEFFGCVPIDRAHEATHEIRDIAQATMQERVPDVTIKCSMAIMKAWRKGASAYYDEAGRLQPWEHSAEFAKLLAKGKVPA